MEINSQHMDELFRIGIQQPAQSNPQKQSGSAEQFDNIFNEALAQSENSSVSVMSDSLLPRPCHADMISKMLLHPIDQDQTSGSETDLLQTAFDTASGTLDLWDSYASTLESSTGDNTLRKAYSILENIGTQVAQLKSNASSLKSQDYGLKSFINELDIMATTERIKFNRGDYA